MNKSLITISLILLFSLVCQFGIAQTTYQVITRKIDKEFTYSPSDKLTIDAEKGVVDIKPWNEQKIKIEITVIVKNQDIATAKKELEYINLNIGKKGGEIIIANSVVLPRGNTLGSIVRVEYSIFLPQGTKVDITDKFGMVKTTDFSGTAMYNLQYCDLVLQNTSGEATITSNVGDLTLNKVNGLTQVVSKYSTLQITNPKGSFDIASTYGDIRVTILEEFKMLNLKAERCDVYVSNKNCIEKSFALESKFGEINLLEPCYVKSKTLLTKAQTGTPPNQTKTCNYSISGKSPQLKVKSIYGNINLD